MRAFFYAAILLSWETRLRVNAKPIVTAEENLFTSLNDDGDSSLFSSVDDGVLVGMAGSDLTSVTGDVDDSDLLIANDGDASSCSSDVGLGDNIGDGLLASDTSDDFLTSRDLDDGILFADSEPKTCVAPGSGKKPDDKPELPRLGDLRVIETDTQQRCHSDNPERACCGIQDGMTPGDCDICRWPRVDFNPHSPPSLAPLPPAEGLFGSSLLRASIF